MTYDEPPLFEMAPTHRRKGPAVIKVEVLVPHEVSIPLEVDILLCYAHQSGEMWEADDLNDPKNLRWAIENAALHAAYEETGCTKDDVEHVYLPKGETYATLAAELANPTWVPIDGRQS